MATYFLKARRADSKTVIWDITAKEFFANTSKRMESYSANTGYVYWDSSFSYNGTLTYEYIKYRNSSGNIITICQNESVTTYDNSYQGAIGLATLPSGYSVLGLLSQNKSNPYLEIRIASYQTIRETETIYNNYIGEGSGTSDALNVVWKEPVIDNLVLTRQHNKEQYSLLVEPNYFDKYNATVTQINFDGNGNDKITYSYTSTSKDSLIKYSYLHEGINKIDLTIHNGTMAVAHTINFMHYTPTITNLTATNADNLIDNTTALTWESTSQARAEIIANGVIIGTITTAKTYIIPKGKLKVGSNTIQVIVYNIADANVANSQVSAAASKTITLSRIMPAVSNVALNGSNTDNELTLKWSSSNQSSYSVIANGATIATGSTEKSAVFSSGALRPSYKSIKVIVYYNSGFDVVEASNEIDVTLTENTPIIYNLEPSNLNKNIDESVVATFETNEFCDRWELKGNDTYISTGSAERKVVYGGGSFKKGNNTLTLTTFYSPAWSNGKVTRTSSKTVTFNGYGAPKAPILNVNDVYSTSNPLISWNTEEEQIAVEYILLKGSEVVASETIGSTCNSITLNGLEDKTEYTIKVRLKNKYELYSAYSIESFSTLFNDILLPDFYLIEGTNSVQITINGHQESTFKSISVYRKDGFNNWLEIADNCNVEDSIIDSTLPCNTNIKYKLRVFNNEGAYKDTEEKAIRISLVNYWLTNIEDFSQSFKMDFVQAAYAFNRNVVYKQYTNQAAPRVFKGRTLYNTVSLTLTMPNDEAFKFVNFIETANDYNVFCYRSWKGEKLFVSVVLNEMAPIEAQLMQITLTLTEINFKESKMYSGGGYRKIVYLNGEYFLDGSVDLSGYDDSIIKVVK